MKLLVTDLEGVEHSIDAMLNWTVMEIIRDGDLPMRAECGGSCACATCHVYVAKEWVNRLPSMDEEERGTLDGGFEVEPNSRLSCQLIMTADLDGLKVTLTQDSAG
jgi:ferredoxin, 2Fe-2S